MGYYGHKIAFIIGNGESRKPVQLDYLREQGVIYGCNALYRDFYPDILVSLDKEMTEEIKEAKYPGYHIYKDLNPNVLIKDKFLIDSNGVKITRNKGWSSGATAAFIAASQIEFKEIYLIGFDLYSTNVMNNVYKDTRNYAKSYELPTSTTSFREQIGKVIKNFPFKHFIWVTNYNQRIWNGSQNYSVMSVSEFKTKFGC